MAYRLLRWMTVYACLMALDACFFSLQMQRNRLQNFVSVTCISGDDVGNRGKGDGGMKKILIIR